MSMLLTGWLKQNVLMINSFVFVSVFGSYYSKGLGIHIEPRI